jgi:hypothetical protein
MASALIGIGGAALRFLDSEPELADAFWMGLVGAAGGLELWSLFFPITGDVSIFVLGVGLTGAAVNRKWVNGRIKAIREEAGWWPIAMLAALMFLVAVRSAGPCDYSDTGLYGAGALRWATTYPAVPGLANVHARLGFNSSAFLCMAALDHGPWKGLTHHLFGGFILCGFFPTLAAAWKRIARNDVVWASDWFYAILTVPMAFWAARAKLVGTLTDEPTTIACWAAVGILCERLSGKPSGAYRMVVATALLCLSVTFKLSAAMFVLLAWIVALAMVWTMEVRTASRNYAALIVAISAAILVPWCIRGMLLSGYPFFPSTAFGFPVDWKVPAGIAKYYARGVQSFGRDPDAYFLKDTEGWKWLGNWLAHAVRNRPAFQTPTLVAVCGSFVALAAQRGAKAPLYRGRQRVLWLLLPSLAGIVFWFLLGPDLRFGQFAIWTMAATLGTVGIVALEERSSAAGRRTASAGILGLMMWCLVSFGWIPPYRELATTEPLSRLRRMDVIEKETRTGLRVQMPVQGIDCWDAALPCAAIFDETLRLRKPGDMRWGFASSASADFIQKLWDAPIR